MPFPASYLPASTFPGAKWLNLALYGDDGTVTGVNGAPTGIRFLARRPLLLESVTSFDAAAQENDVLWLLCALADTTNAYQSYGDTAGAWGRGADSPGGQASYRYYPGVPVSSGFPAGPNQGAGGWTIFGHFAPVTWATGQQAVGAQLYQVLTSSPFTSPVTLATGSWQASDTSRDNCPFVLDLISTVPPAGQSITPALAFTVTGTPASPSLVANSAGNSGETPRFFSFWTGATLWDAPNPAPGLPSPLPQYEPGTVISSSLLNGSSGICDLVNFLQSPPMMRAAAALTTSIPSNTTTALTFPAAPVSNFTNPAPNFTTYVVQRDGLYLGHATTLWNINSTGTRATGIEVNGTVYWGPGYPAPAGGTCVSTKTQVFSLRAGDTVTAVCRQNSGAARTLSSAHQSRFLLAWIGGSGAPSSFWPPPDPGFQWQAGTPGSDLPGLMTEHLAGDLGFLFQRPYFLGWQSQPQAGLPQDSFSQVTTDKLTGIVHGDDGDPWNGWSAEFGAWTPPAAGWYLVIGEVFGTAAPSGASIAAGVLPEASSSPMATADWYQHMAASTSSGLPPGGTFASLYYLTEGTPVSAQVMCQDYGGTYGTSAGTLSGGTVASHIEVVYLAQA